MDQLTLEQHRLELVGRIAGGVAHDFKNILTVVVGAAELAVDAVAGSRDNRQILPLLRQITDAANRGSDLAQHLLAFAAGRGAERVEFDLDERILAWSAVLARMIGERHELELVLGCGPASVSADPLAVQQVLTNLIVNARDAMPSGGIITLETRRKDDGGGHVVLSVGDSGVGMDTATLARACDPFFTTKPDGGGIGLAIVRDVVSRLDGVLLVESTPGVGTTATVTLPIVPRRADPDPEPSTEEPLRRRILLVEDDEEVREITLRVLEFLGYDAVAVSNGDGALALDERFACVMTDIELPGMPGPDLVNLLRKRQPKLPALVVSGYVDSVPIEDDDATRFLAKPFELSQLAAALEALLPGRVAAGATARAADS